MPEFTDQAGVPQISNAFQEKQRPEQVVEIDPNKGPLTDLQKDEFEVNAFSFFVDNRPSNQALSFSELTQRLNIAKFDDRGYALDARNNYVRSFGAALQLPANERFVIQDQGQKEVLQQFLDEKSGSRDILRATQQTLNGLDFFTQTLESGRYSPKELTQRLNIARFDDRGYALDARNEYVRSFGAALQLPANERFVIQDQGQKEVLQSLNDEKTRADEKRNNAQKSLQGLDFFTQTLASGSLTPQEITQRLNIARFDDRGYALDARNEYVRSFGAALQLPANERFTIKDQGQKDILANLNNYIANPQIPQEVKDLTKRYLTTNNFADLTRLQTLLTDQGGSTDILTTINDVTTIRKRLQLKNDFYNALSQNGSESALGVLSAYEGQDTEDVALRAELAQRALGARRLRIASEFTSLAVNPSRDIDQALAVLGPLSSSQSPEDRQCAVVLTEALYRAELAANRKAAIDMIALDKNPEEIYAFIDALPIRPSVNGLDYLAQQVALKDTIKQICPTFEKIARLNRGCDIRRKFNTASLDEVLTEIGNLPENSQEDLLLKAQLKELYKSYTAANKPGDFDERFAQEMNAKAQADLKSRFERPELGKNVEGFRLIRENYRKYIAPLVDSLRDDPRTRDAVSEVLDLQREGGEKINPRNLFTLRITELEKQRDLTDMEKTYIESAKLLSLYNPFLVAALMADKGVTGEYLTHHFDKVSRETKKGLSEGMYIPLIQFGTGPEGLAALGELARNNPELLRQTLVVDSGEQPGGPFAIPKGPAWELNSANRRGSGGYILPDRPRDELRTVRSFGSPVSRWYPGERKTGSDIRGGSINTTVDYLPAPDDLSNSRYPTNEELQRLLAMQTAVLTDNVGFETTVVSVEPNTDTTIKGDKKVTLRIVEDGDERTISLYADAVWGASGLGEKTYGFPLEGSRAEQVIEETQEYEGFPRISTTLDAFNAFADRSGEKKSPGETLVIWGKGNSADTLIEFVGNIFQGDNPAVRDITKIYILSDGDLSSRPRYSLISDLKPRNGSGNLIEQINARVADVDFDNVDVPLEERKLVFYDKDGNEIVDRQGRTITGDSGIAATGFKPTLNRVFASYLNGKSIRDRGDDAPLQPLTLPTNPGVTVAEYFKDDPNILLLGTATRDGFESLEKKAQLPREAREALLRNGVENAVAIGFRAPDTQAATNIWLNTRTVELDQKEEQPLPQIPLEGEFGAGEGRSIDRIIPERLQRIPNDADTLDQGELLLSSLIAYNLNNQFELLDGRGDNVEFTLRPDAEGNFAIEFTNGSVERISGEFIENLTTALADEYIQRYATNIFANRRRDPKLDIKISFRNGKIDAKNTYTQVS